jgi:hypothetical protein
MARSVVSICNLALLRLGKDPINSLTEGTPQAICCAAMYDEAVMSVLREFPWNFAQTWVALVKDTTPPPMTFAFSYHLPTDCVKMNWVADKTTVFSVVGNRIYTNADDAIGCYTQLITDPSRFDASFADCLAARLAADMCEPLTTSTTKQQAFFTIYQNKVHQAWIADSSEGQADPDHDDTWLSASGFGTDPITTRLG